MGPGNGDTRAVLSIYKSLPTEPMTHMKNITPEDMNDITDALMIGLRNRFPEGVNLIHVAMVMASLSVKLLHDNGVETEEAKRAVTEYIGGIDPDEITPVSIN